MSWLDIGFVQNEKGLPIGSQISVTEDFQEIQGLLKFSPEILYMGLERTFFVTYSRFYRHLCALQDKLWLVPTSPLSEKMDTTCFCVDRP